MNSDDIAKYYARVEKLDPNELEREKKPRRGLRARLVEAVKEPLEQFKMTVAFGQSVKTPIKT